MIGDQVVSSYDPKVFGKWDHVATRWKHIVGILDHYLPDSGVPLERIRVVYHTRHGTQYDCAAQMERRNGRVTVHAHWAPGIPQVPTTKPELTQWGPRPRVEVRVPYQFNRIRSVQPHPDAPCQNLSGEVTYPAWATSYTKKVVEKIDETIGTMLGDNWDEEGLGIQNLRAAQKLLREYHQTQHEVYEQRDEARKEVEELTQKLAMKQVCLNIARDQRHDTLKDAASLHAKLQRVREILDQTEAAA